MRIIKMFRGHLLVLAILLLVPFSNLKAQDTTVVQTFTFKDITKRRGYYQFPAKDKTFSKILMYYTLKCDPQTTKDKYDCGEWDYLTYTMIYDHNATYDSTYKTAKWFNVGASSTYSSFGYSSKPVQSYFYRYNYQLKKDSVLTYKSSSAKQATGSSDLFKTDANGKRIQMLWLADDLKKSALDSGLINGIQLNLVKKSSKPAFIVIKMALTTDDSLSSHFLNTNWETVYQGYYNFMDTGWVKIPFIKDFMWDHQQNIVFDISILTKGNTVELRTENTVAPMVISADNSSLAMNFSDNGDQILCGHYPEIEGNNAKTVEFWARTDAFNAGGLVAIGRRGSSLQDFSIRTMTSNNVFRAQLWGADFDVTVPDALNNWHHFALSYDGAKAVLYVDGQLAGQKAATLNTASNTIEIGSWNGKYFKGAIDEVRIWKKALSQEEILSWMSKKIDATHTSYAQLLANYTFEENQGYVAQNEVKSGYQGDIRGNAWWTKVPVENTFTGVNMDTKRPVIIFEQTTAVKEVDSMLVMDSIVASGKRLFFRNNPYGSYLIDNNAKNHPSLISDTIIGWQATDQYLTDPVSGAIVDTVKVVPEKTFVNKTLYWYSADVTYEIGRFITPYGIGLDLGPDGFTWVYDVTDYAGLLHDSVDISTGNQQELVDVKFVMIEGTPARDVIDIKHVWDQGHPSYRYEDLDNDVKAYPKKMAVLSDAKSLKLRSRLTGHGHNSNDGSYPHCCEWKDNTHYIYINGSQQDEWHIWRDNCDLNPVYPQGGTWPGAREGWCPGSLVQDHETDLSAYVGKDSVKIDYRITPVPNNNTGMGRGNYVFNVQLFQYGKANYSLDAELYEITKPSTEGIYSRENPICYEPTIVIRNGGSTELTKLTIEYGVTESNLATYEWEGRLSFMQTEEVILPIPDLNFWKTNENRFIVRLKDPNGKSDENMNNNNQEIHFDIPDTYDEPFIVYLKTNAYPNENEWEIRDIFGNTVMSRKDMNANTLYRDTVDLPKGCYTFQLFDEGYGLSYWAWPDQGSGSLYFRSTKGKVLKSFEPDFGEKIFYAFTLGFPLGIEDPGHMQSLIIYPNPVEDILMIETPGIAGISTITINDMNGKQVYAKHTVLNGENTLQVNTKQFPSGLYLVRVVTGSEVRTERFMKN